MLIFLQFITLLAASGLCLAEPNESRKSFEEINGAPSWWLGYGSASNSHSYDAGPLASLRAAGQHSLSLGYLHPINKDLSLNTYFKFLQEKWEKENELNSVSQFMLGGSLRFHWEIESIRLFIGPSLGSVIFPEQHEIQSQNSFSYGTHFGFQFELFDSLWSIENQKTYLLTGANQGGSFNEVFLKWKVL